LEFTYIGYQKLEVPVTSNSKNLRIVMKENVQLLDEVVVVGYGTMKKRDLTGAISSVSAETLNQTVAINLDQMLQGKVSGVQITQNSGAPGGATSIRIRGATSISNTNEPLYIIDGIPFPGTGATIGGFEWAGGSNGQNVVNPLSTIAPSDIISIDILKDASATAIYGANGGNGVIIVTTKRGKAGKISINYDGYVTTQQVAKKLDLMNLSEYAQYQIELADFLGQSADPAYLDPSILGKGTDWQDEIFRTAISQSHQISLTGGNEKIQFAASGGYSDNKGIIIGSDFNRFNSRLNVDGTINNWIKAGSSLAFTHTEETITNNDGTDGVILQALTMQPSIPVYNFDGTWAGPNDVNGASQYNPLWLAEMKNNLLNRNRIIGNFYLSIDPLKGLNIRSEYGFNFDSSNNISFVPTYSFGAIGNDINKMLKRDEQSSSWMWKNYATYNKSFDKHAFTLMIGSEISESSWGGYQIVKQKFSTNDIHVMTNDGEFLNDNGWKDRATGVSVFGRLNYTYNDRYLATATLRADGSSKFGQNNKWGYFPSAAVAWRLSSEDFLADNNLISNLKLRLGYGQVGNAQIGTYLYGSSMRSMITPFGTAYRLSNIANPNLKWEASEQYNIGLDFGIFKERISLALDVYRKDTKDLLLQVSVPPYLGGSGYDDIASPMANIGKIQNNGLDITLNTVNITNPDFSWHSNVIFSLNRNEVLALNDNSQRIYSKLDWWSEFQTATLVQVGQPIGVFYGYQVDRLFTDKLDILNSPLQMADPDNPNVNLFNQNTGVYIGDIKFKDISGPDGKPDGIINDYDQTVIGDPNPDFTFGFTNTFTLFKNWEIGIGLTGAYGFDILNFSRFRTEGMTSIWDNQAASVTKRAQIGVDENENKYLLNPGTSMPRPSTNDFNRNNRMSTRFIEDGSYLRIQNLSIGYRLPVSLLQKIKVQNVKVYVNAQNLYTFTKYTGYDPEIGAHNQSSLLQNIDRGRYPTPRSVTFGLNVEF
jgi:TonB-linked SusC/RagA family outer membrane protein